MSESRITDWHLGQLVMDPTTGKATTWDMGDPVDLVVVDRHRQSVNLLIELMTESPYSGLEKRYVELKSAMAAVRSPKFQVGTMPQRSSEIRACLDNMLSALRAFDDRTSRDLKHKFGEGSVSFRTFKEALSYEYDNEFAYRFMYRLRNYSQHCGQPELSGGVKGSLAADGTPVRQVSRAFDSSVLLERFDKWGPVVKGELQKIGGKFEAEPIVDQLMLSCGRAYSKMIVSQADAIRSASEFIRECDKSTDGAVPCFFGLNRDEWLSDGPRNTALQLVRIDLASHAENLLVAAQAVADGTQGKSGDV